MYVCMYVCCVMCDGRADNGLRCMVRLFYGFAMG